MLIKEKFLLEDYTEVYKPIMQFNKNKTEAIHQWYPFVEGYSKEFIEGILNELDYEPKSCLEPFVGSGTTPVELQNYGIQCTSFEVSPFMHLLAKVKLNKAYKLKEFITQKNDLESVLLTLRRDKVMLSPPVANTIVERQDLAKWIFNHEVMDGLLDIKFAVDKIQSKTYRDLFRIAFASILLEVSNVFRNGKCLSYKKDWRHLQRRSRASIHEVFMERVEKRILPDIDGIEKSALDSKISNYDECHLSDVRKGLLNQKDNKFDLMITSPPYLNSRDYTDIYRIELWMLDLINTYEEMQSLRKQTLISHVQIKHGIIHTIDIKKLKDVIEAIEGYADIWNTDIPTMIKGYFRDMDYLFFNLKSKMKANKSMYFNVANSAYCGQEIVVDEIIAEIAERNGFYVKEIRKARNLKTSAQQKGLVGSLRESVIVIKT